MSTAKLLIQTEKGSLNLRLSEVEARKMFYPYFFLWHKWLSCQEKKSSVCVVGSENQTINDIKLVRQKGRG